MYHICQPTVLILQIAPLRAAAAGMMALEPELTSGMLWTNSLPALPPQGDQTSSHMQRMPHCVS